YNNTHRKEAAGNPGKLADCLHTAPKGRSRKVAISNPSDNPEGRMYAPIYLPRSEANRPEVGARQVREAGRRTTYAGCMRGTCDAAPRFRVSTCVTERERQQIDVGAAKCVCATHRDTLSDVVADFTAGAVDGAVISAARLSTESLPKLRALV